MDKIIELFILATLTCAILAGLENAIKTLVREEIKKEFWRRGL